MMVDPAEIPVVILAGGRGARFDSESQVTPKPMIEVAGRPILQHIIDSFVMQGFREFIVPTGFLHEQVDAHFGRLGQPTAPNRYACPGVGQSPWLCRYDVHVAFTGLEAHTGLRLYRVRDMINGRRFVLTYGDGLSNVDMRAVLQQHEDTGAGATVTAVRPPGRFGVIEFSDDAHEQSSSPTLVHTFSEKADVGWINGGFMVMEPEFITQYIEGEFELESTALSELAASGGMHAYRHDGYWRCMDTRRDREQIEEDVRRAGCLPWMR